MEDSSPFLGLYRRCCGCGKLQKKGSYSKCSKCKVFVYCGITCQTKHWKAEHKTSCKVQAAQPPPLPVYIPALEIIDETDPRCREEGEGEVHDDEADLDKPYKYLLIRPPTINEKMTKKEWQSTVIGIDTITTESVIDPLVNAQNGPELSSYLNNFKPDKSAPKDSASAVISAAIITARMMYNWKTFGSSLVPGYSARYDGYNLRGLYDENNRTCPELLPNRNGGLLYMQPEGVCHGNIVVWCTAEANNTEQSSDDTTGINTATEQQELAQKPKPDQTIPITRRNILQTIEYNLECGFANSVPERIHFENITRAAALKVFKKENFTMIDA